MDNANLPRDHWRALLPESLQKSFEKLIAMSTMDEQNPMLLQQSYRVIGDLREASSLLGKRRSFVSLRFVAHYPFLVCANRQSGGRWRAPYYLFERLTDSYEFRLPKGWVLEEAFQAKFSRQSASDWVSKLIRDFPASRASTEFEMSYILACLQLCNGSKTATCKLCGMSRASFYRRIAEFRALAIGSE